MSPERRWNQVVVLVVAGLAVSAGSASGSLIATDSYLIGPGAYTAGLALKSQPSVGSSEGAVGFAASSKYSMGSGSGNWAVNTGGLYASNPNNAGEVSFTGYTQDNAIRSDARGLATVATPSTLWFSIVVSQDGTSTPYAANGYALAGFGNTTPPTLGTTYANGLSGTNAYLTGLFFGFAHEPGDPTSSPNSDLVIRYRNTTGYTAGDTVLVSNAASNVAYTIVARVQVNSGGGSADLLTYWLDPTDTSSVAAMDATSMNNDGSPVTTYGFQGNSSDLLRLTYSAQNWGGDGQSANFGGPTVGTSMADVVSVPEPASLVLLGLGLIGGLAPAMRRRGARA